jgi:FAD/FMN-containing dehydrogenase
MRSFNDVGLDETRAEVRIGGGCLAGEVLKTSAAKGWYTCIPSSNAVGMVGALLGGLNHPLVRRHGLGIDCIKSISIIPFTRPGGGDTRELIVNEESDGEERRLFNALCGAGHGLGVVTSITLKAWQIADLGLTGAYAFDLVS